MEVKKLLEELEKNLEDSKLGRYPEVIVEVANDTEKFRTRREIVEGTLEWCIKKIKKIMEESGYDEVRLLMKVKSAVQGLLEALEKKKKKLKEDLSVLKGFMNFRQRRDFILILEWIDWFEQEIKKWFADVIEE